MYTCSLNLLAKSPCIHSSIHHFLPLIQGSWWQQSKQEFQTFHSLETFLQLLLEDPEASQGQMRYVIHPMSSGSILGVSSQLDVPGRCPEGILIRCLNHLQVRLLHSLQISELLTLSLRLRPVHGGNSFWPLVSSTSFFWSLLQAQNHRSVGTQIDW